MKEVYIDGKKYYQQERCDIEKLPAMTYPKDLLTKYQPERLSEKGQLSGISGKLACDSPNTPTKGSESSRND